MNKILLTVAIPTYNRPAKATALINKLNSLESPIEYELLVADNCTNNGQVLIDSNLEYRNFKYLKRTVNIGLLANVMRLYEEAAGKWLVILGDDDDVSSDFFFNIHSEILAAQNKSKSNLLAVKFKTALDENQRNLNVLDKDSFLNLLSDPDVFSTTILISSWMFNREHLIQYVRYSYLYSGLQIPHVCPVIAALEDDTTSYVKYSTLETAVHKTPDSGDLWNFGLTFGMMITTVFVCNFFQSKRQIKSFIKGITGNNIVKTVSFLLKVKLTVSKITYNQICRSLKSISLTYSVSIIATNIASVLLPKSILRNRFHSIIVSNSTVRM